MLLTSLCVLSLYIFYIYRFFARFAFLKKIFNNMLISRVLVLISLIFTEVKTWVVTTSTFLPLYYKRNEGIWVDGFLFDFLQKKTADLWIRKFIIYTGFIFSERLTFETLIKIYLDNLIWPLHYLGILEANNVLEMLLITLFLYFFFFALLVLLYVCFF